MPYDLIIRGAKLVRPSGIEEGDIGIQKGKIAAIGEIQEKGKEEVDAAGLYVLPGGIDMHVHFRDPGMPDAENFETGSAAAAAGGITTVIDMPNTTPPTTTVHALEEKRRRALKTSHVNYGFFFGLTEANQTEIERAGNIAGVKIYLAESTGGLLVKNPSLLEKIFASEKLLIIHAEDQHVIDEHRQKYPADGNPAAHSLIRCADAALEAVKKILHLAKKYETRLHITHVTTKAEIDEIRKCKSARVTADATPHHLFLNEHAYAKLGNFAKVNPPLRSEEDRLALWQALRDGTLACVASDHAPHPRAEKEKTYEDAPAGMPGVETLLPLLLDAVSHGELSVEDVARLTSKNPAKILGLKHKGRLEIGCDADLVLVDMQKEMTVGERGYFTKCGWSAFEGWKLRGWPVVTVVGGQIIFENGRMKEGAQGTEVKLGD